ncbi:hypothetical protein [Actinopolyspora halophila]|uniref:hypothetical protein n=1 Tax=Actinopolyspora halophila TaxID=1850 RepID=UPI0012FBA27D|nr:hypothetical protein [Actinopolyspora halophila]
MPQDRTTKPSVRQRITLAGVLCLAGGVVAMAVLQLTEVIDRMNTLITVFFLFTTFVGVGASLGWLPERPGR